LTVWRSADSLRSVTTSPKRCSEAYLPTRDGRAYHPYDYSSYTGCLIVGAFSSNSVLSGSRYLRQGALCPAYLNDIVNAARPASACGHLRPISTPSDARLRICRFGERASLLSRSTCRMEFIADQHSAETGPINFEKNCLKRIFSISRFPVNYNAIIFHVFTMYWCICSYGNERTRCVYNLMLRNKDTVCCAVLCYRSVSLSIYLVAST